MVSLHSESEKQSGTPTLFFIAIVIWEFCVGNLVVHVLDIIVNPDALCAEQPIGVVDYC